MSFAKFASVDLNVDDVLSEEAFKSLYVTAKEKKVG
jgi:hypothetical protein